MEKLRQGGGISPNAASPRCAVAAATKGAASNTSKSREAGLGWAECGILAEEAANGREVGLRGGNCLARGTYFLGKVSTLSL